MFYHVHATKSCIQSSFFKTNPEDEHALAASKL